MKPIATIIHTYSTECLGNELENSAAVRFFQIASAVWPVASLAIFLPFHICSETLVTQLFAINGAAVAGNIEVGIYSIDGVKLTSNVNAAQAGTSVAQAFNITDIILTPDVYYLACSMSNAAGTTYRGQMTPTGGGFAVEVCKVLGVAQMAAANPLPANAVLATSAQNYLPVIGLIGRAVL